MLYKHGLLAALNSPVVGLGAGVFSGISGPLQQFESHNTFIDLMTNGGIILSALFYYPFIRAIVSLYKDNPYKSAVITAFLAFTLFHLLRGILLYGLHGAAVWLICKIRAQNVRSELCF